MRNFQLNTALILGVCALLFASCGADKTHPGYEYMPNMYRSPSIEIYEPDTTINRSGLASFQPVKGTVPRGFMPFQYENTLEGYLAAGEELVNPLDSTERHLTEGKVLYGQFCKHCHGEKGSGKGSIQHPVFSAIPAYSSANPPRRSGTGMKDLKSGHIYHTIMYGLNAMGSHASQITEEERWKIVHYVHALQEGDN